MAEIKYYAAQVSPEDQDPNFDECCWPGWIVTGNRHYSGFVTAEYNKLFEATPYSGECLMDEMLDQYQQMKDGDGCAWYSTLEELLQEELGDYNRDWTPEQLEQWKEILSFDYSKPGWNLAEDDMKCKALSLLCNREYATKEIHGDCQGDWQRCYYPKDEENLLNDLEMTYFNTGEEWDVVDAEELKDHGEPAPENGQDVMRMESIYCSAYIDGFHARENLAEYLGCQPDEIKMWRWKGYRKISEYEEAI